MIQLTAILVDDEVRARRVLRSLLEKTVPELVILEECGDLMEAVASIKELKPTVVFLDVQMPNYAGYEIVNFFDTIDFEIIFVTAYNQFAIKAFEVCAIDYLVKPIDRQKLSTAVEKLSIKVSAANKILEYQVLLENIKSKKSSKIIIPELGNRRIINTDEIIGIEAEGAYTRINMVGNEQIMTSKNLKYFEQILENNTSFYRSHRSWIINIKYLKQFNRSKNILILEEGWSAKIARNNYEAFESLIQQK